MKDKEIAFECPDIDLVIGAHSHSFLYSGDGPERKKADGPYPIWITQESGRKVPVVQASAFTKYLGLLELEVTIDSHPKFSIKFPMIAVQHRRRDGEFEWLPTPPKQFDPRRSIDSETIRKVSSQIDCLGNQCGWEFHKLY
jgi:hypothetical protein